MIDLPPAELRARLSDVLPVERWVEGVLGAAPFESLDQLVAVATDAADPFSADEVDAALDRQPGLSTPPAERPATDVVDAERDSAGGSPAARALEEGTATYEARFGRRFVLRTAGRSTQDVLDELERRLRLDDDSELREVGVQLREIAAVRLRSLAAADTVEARVTAAGSGSAA